MAVRFKFRSSPAVDSIDLGGRPSISVRELRSKILESSKLLRASSGFHLLISDATSNKTFDDEDFQIQAGSDVIIKRVPSGASGPSELADTKRGATRDTNAPSSKNNLDNFEDFGNDVYPAFDSLLGESDQDVANFNSKNARYHNNDESDLSEAISKEIVGENCKYASDAEEDRKESKTKTRSEEYKKSTEGGKCSPAMFSTDLPTELRCPLCHAIFKDAVMIPCCQHSFCDRCIRSTLIEVRKCPKCSSNKCSIDDLLPNLSLRQAIERFIEAQASIGAMDNDLLPKDAPDGESGIQAIEKQEVNNLNSPSATGKGSNRVQPESTPENKRNAAGLKIRLDDSKPVNPVTTDPQGNVGQTSVENNNNKSGGMNLNLKQGAELQAGGSKITRYPQDNIEGNMPIQRRPDFAFNNQDGPGAGMQQQNKFFNNNRRGDRTCYFCGSPSHFIRDCPNRFSGDGGYQGNNNNINNTNNNASGYVPPVDWAGAGPAFNNNAFNAYRPAFNMYANPALGVNPYDHTGAFGVNPYQMSSYMPPYYSGMANPYGYMNMRMGNMGNMGGMGPTMPGGSLERPVGQYMDPRTGWYANMTAGDPADRDGEYDERSEDYQYNETQTQRNPPRRRPHDSESESPDEDYPHRSSKPPKKHGKQQHFSSDEETPFERKPEKERERVRERDRRPEKEKSVSEASSERHGSRHRKGKEVSERTNVPSTLESRERKNSGSTLESRERKNSSSTLESREKRGSVKGKEGSERKRESERWEMVDGSDHEDRRRERHHSRRKRH